MSRIPVAAAVVCIVLAYTWAEAVPIAAHALGDLSDWSLKGSQGSQHSQGRALKQAAASTNGGGVVAGLNNAAGAAATAARQCSNAAQSTALNFGTPLFSGSAKAIAGVLTSGFAAANAASSQFPPVSTATTAACQAANDTAYATNANEAVNQAAQANNYAASAESSASSTFINSVFQNILGTPGAVGAGAVAGRRLLDGN
ncbi:hypothetical protein WJX84_003620 [Apatococcus fuscideae]|uniref:Uncharacterized protein n=1 Tax=Apatococcus fuscideae TaxID=2026836 RepID=A0AAW1TGK1_9CHLO